MPLLDKQPDLIDPLVECYSSTFVFGNTFLSKRFWRKPTSMHDEFFEILDDPAKTRVAIAAPRGFGKTTWDSIALPARAICFKDAAFIEMVSCTAAIASQNVRNLGRELESNAKIVKTFGNLKGKIWAEGIGHLETNTGITIKARGAGQQIRGLLEDGSRPDLIIVDDLEDPEAFRIGDATEYLRKIKEWFWSDLMNSIDRRPHTRVLVVGTILHEDSLLQNLLDDPKWSSVRLEICDSNGASNFPDYMTTKEIAELKKEHEDRGQLELFYREYMNMAVSDETAVFSKNNFRYYPETYDPHLDYQIDRVVLVDPAKTTNVKSAYTAIVGVGFNPLENHIYVIEVINEKLGPDEIYKKAHEMAIRLRTTTIGVEVTTLSMWISYPFNNYLREKSFPAIVELQAKGDKADRIRMLAPFYRMGQVYHNTALKETALELQLRAFPRSKFWDAMDALAYCIPMFSIGERYFGPDDGADEEENIKELDAEIAVMDAEDNMLDPRRSGNFHWAP